MTTMIPPWIETATGRQFPYSDPFNAPWCIEDVAEALSKLCRYNGHTTRFYSVAEHCVLMTRWAIETRVGLDNHELLTLLLHDAAEAYLGDVPSPLKGLLPDYKALELQFDEAAAQHFGTIYPFPSWLKAYDARILVDERAQVMTETKHVWGADGLRPLGVRVECLTPWQARDAFLQLYQSLKGGF